MFFWKKSSAAGMTKAAVVREKRTIIEQDGPWTAHSIPLGHGLMTMDVARNYDTLKLELCVKTIAENAGKPIAALRVLDLACLEGMYAIEFARFGAEVLGIDAREISLRKARFATKALGLRKLECLRDDVRNISAEKYGEFDVVLMNGILYHIDRADQLPFLKAAARMCTKMMYIDTHVAQVPDKEITEKDMIFTGTEWQEFAPETLPTERETMLWASYENPRSFKLSLSSLHAALKCVGFETTEELQKIEGQPKDRIVILAKK